MTSGGCAWPGSSAGCPVATATPLTADGIRIAVFYTKLYNRLLLLTAADQPQAPLTCTPRWPPSPATWTTTPPAPARPPPRET